MFLFKHYYVNEKLLKFDYTIFFGFFFRNHILNTIKLIF